MNIPTSKNYDSDFCGSLPLHFINLVQPHGFIMVVQKETFIIRQISENASEFLGIKASELLNQELGKFVLAAQIAIFRRKTQQWNIDDRIPEEITFNVDNTEKKFSAVIHAKENYILLELEPSLPLAAGDVDFVHIYQAIMFILVAFHRDYYRPIKIKLPTRRTPEYSVLVVEDNGLGIDTSHQTKLFSIFKRFHNHVDGSGMGLYTVNKIVENAGGKMEVQSKPGAGSTCKIFLKK